MKLLNAAIGGAILYALACLFSAYPVLAGESTPLPAVGDTVTPTPRLLCTNKVALPTIFDGITDPTTLRARVIATKGLAINGMPLCASVSFEKPVTVTQVVEIGSVDFADGRTAKAYSVTVRFRTGDEMFALWFKTIEGKGI